MQEIKKNSADEPYRGERDTNPSKQAGDAINSRNNNQETDGPSIDDPEMIRPDNSAIGDAAQNGQPMTSYNSNSSSDA